MSGRRSRSPTRPPRKGRGGNGLTAPRAGCVSRPTPIVSSTPPTGACASRGGPIRRREGGSRPGGIVRPTGPRSPPTTGTARRGGTGLGAVGPARAGPRPTVSRASISVCLFAYCVTTHFTSLRKGGRPGFPVIVTLYETPFYPLLCEKNVYARKIERFRCFRPI